MAEASESVGSIVLKFAKGIDNRSREYALSEGAARELNNLDVTRDGGLRCRQGLRLVMIGAFHSLFCPPRHAFALLVRDGFLCRMQGVDLTELVPVSGPVTYALLNDEIFWSDGTTTGRVRADGKPDVWGLNTPGMPSYSLAGGALDAGRYLMTMTAIQAATGLESGAGEPVLIEVSTGMGIRVVAPTAVGFRFAYYLTPANGERHELRRAAILESGAVTTLNGGGLGKPLRSLFMVKPLPSQALVMFKGRLWGASGKTVWFTSEATPHWLFSSEGYYQFESPVTMLGVTENGIYVGLYDRTYFLKGDDPTKMTQRQVSDEGALAGGGANCPISLFSGKAELPVQQCFWWDTHGFLCIGKPEGIIVRPNDDRYSAGLAHTAIGCYRSFDGIRQLVSVLDFQDANAGQLQATDTAVSAVFAHSTSLEINQ